MTTVTITPVCVVEWQEVDGKVMKAFFTEVDHALSCARHVSKTIGVSLATTTTAMIEFKNGRTSDVKAGHFKVD